MERRPEPGRRRGVSEVISVLLMVSVTIVLAAMAGSVLLDVLGDVEDNPIAGASVEFDAEDEEIDVVYTATQQKGTTITVSVENDSGTEIARSPVTLDEVGESVTFGPPPGRYTVTIVATAPNGQEAVVLRKDGRV